MTNNRASWSSPEKKPAAPSAKNPREVSDFQAARARKEHYRALEVQRQLESAMADLCEMREIENALDDFMKAARRVLMAWADEISPRLVTVTDPDRVEAILLSESLSILETLGDEIDNLSEG